MRRDETRFAAAARDDGIRKIGKLTWRAGALGVAGSALIAIAFGHHTAAAPSGSGHAGQGTIVVPAQPPAPARGPGQVTSGAS